MKRDAPLPDAAAPEDCFAAWSREPRAQDFFAVLRRFEVLHPELPRLGRALRPAQEPLRLSQEPELDFAPAALATFDATRDGPPRLGVRFFGLLGPQGPMPLHFTEHVRERLRFRGDAATARFLDLFHHRLLLLFYRAWAQGQPTVQIDRPDDDRFAAWLGAAAGLTGSEQGPRALPEAARLFQAGLLGARSRHPEGLVNILAQHFRVPVRIDAHVAHWLPLEDEDRTRLGMKAHQLGVAASSGRKVRDRQYQFRIVLGPLTLLQYESFLPGGRAWPALREWVRHYAGLDLRWDLQLALQRDHIPPPRLARGIRLGVTTWIGRVGHAPERHDLRLRPATSSLLRTGGCHA